MPSAMTIARMTETYSKALMPRVSGQRDLSREAWPYHKRRAWSVFGI